MEHREGSFPGAAGAGIYWQGWLPAGEPRALIVVVHGAAEHGGRYRGFAEYFCAEGYAVAALDHPGHGRSEGARGHVRRFDDYLECLDAFRRVLADEYPAVPQVLLGHSLGGLISANYLLQRQADFAGCVLSGPAIKTELEPPLWQRLLIRLFALLAPTMGALQLDASGVSRDPEEVRRYREDPLNYSGKLSARMVSELFAAMGKIQADAGRIELPLLLLHGGADVMTAPAGSRFLYENVSSADKKLKIYPGLYHEIFNEPERLEVFADISSWLSRLPDKDGSSAAPAPESSAD